MKAFAALLLSAFSLAAQAANTPENANWKALDFLAGTWTASTQGKGDAGASVLGTYTFQRELSGHVLARHSTRSGCTGPAAFDCEHGDLFYVFEEAPGQPLKAIYFDNEGHVIHYSVSTPQPTTAIFLSDVTQPGPQFRIVYQLKGPVMSGKFQMRPPGKTEWTSYLEWSGAAKK